MITITGKFIYRGKITQKFYVAIFWNKERILPQSKFRNLANFNIKNVSCWQKICKKNSETISILFTTNFKQTPTAGAEKYAGWWSALEYKQLNDRRR
jgi:hypothetical protein